jgi:uncharacterized membrane protein YfcA
LSDDVRTPPDHGAGRGVPDHAVPWRVFAAVGLGLAVITLVYGVAASEEAGKALLTLTVAFLLWIAAYLWLRTRPPEEEVEPAEPYLPHASIWPFGMAVGAYMLANGLLIGGWFYLPGLFVTVLSLAGFIRQSRARS